MSAKRRWATVESRMRRLMAINGWSSGREMARECGVSEATINSAIKREVIKRDNTIGVYVGKKIAARTKANLAWVLTGEGPSGLGGDDDDVPTMPPVQKVEGSQEDDAVPDSVRTAELTAPHTPSAPNSAPINKRRRP